MTWTLVMCPLRGQREQNSVTLHAISPCWIGEIVYRAVTSQDRKVNPQICYSCSNPLLCLHAEHPVRQTFRSLFWVDVDGKYECNNSVFLIHLKKCTAPSAALNMQQQDLWVKAQPKNLLIHLPCPCNSSFPPAWHLFQPSCSALELHDIFNNVAHLGAQPRGAAVALGHPAAVGVMEGLCWGQRVQHPPSGPGNPPAPPALQRPRCPSLGLWDTGCPRIPPCTRRKAAGTEKTGGQAYVCP